MARSVHLSAWSQRMVVAECLAVALISIGEDELDVTDDELARAFSSAWSGWSAISLFPVIKPARIVDLLSGPATVSDAIAHWRATTPFRASLAAGYPSPASVAELIHDYTQVPLPEWEQLARSLVTELGIPRPEHAA